MTQMTTSTRTARLLAVCAVALMATVLPAIGASPIQLSDVTAATGIAFRHNDGSGGKRYIIEPMSAGVASINDRSSGKFHGLMTPTSS